MLESFGNFLLAVAVSGVTFMSVSRLSVCRMDEKTEELRDIFMDVAEEGTVTESQTEQRGSLLRDESVDERLMAVIGRMRDRFGFDTDLADNVLCTIIRQFYDGEGDAGIATILSVPEDLVVEARLDLHLVRDEDAEGVDVDVLGDRLDAGHPEMAIAADMDADPETVVRATQVLEAKRRSRRVSHRFRTEFKEILTDADIAVRLTADTQEDGLEEATEGMEVDVDF